MRINESTLHEATESSQPKKVSGYLRTLAVQSRARRIHRKERYPDN